MPHSDRYLAPLVRTKGDVLDTVKLAQDQKQNSYLFVKKKKCEFKGHCER